MTAGIEVNLAEASDDTVAAVRELREEIAPDAFAGTESEVLVAGTASENIDYFDSVIDPAPYVIAFVLLLTFVLLTVVFRSVVVAATAVLLNLLSVGAAYGLLVGVFVVMRLNGIFQPQIGLFLIALALVAEVTLTAGSGSRG